MTRLGLLSFKVVIFDVQQGCVIRLEKGGAQVSTTPAFFPLAVSTSRWSNAGHLLVIAQDRPGIAEAQGTERIEIWSLPKARKLRGFGWSEQRGLSTRRFFPRPRMDGPGHSTRVACFSAKLLGSSLPVQKLSTVQGQAHEADPPLIDAMASPSLPVSHKPFFHCQR